MMGMDLHNKVAVVTGGTSGIGLETARLFLASGAKVAICGRDEDRLSQANKLLSGEFSRDNVLAYKTDVLDRQNVEAFSEAVGTRLGVADMLVNNAGQGRVSTFADTSDDAWREELELKFFSIIYPTRAFLSQLEQSDSGSIVCVNSLLAAQPEPHMVCTSAARSGALNLTHSLADEFACKGIRVNSVLIGLVESGQWYRRFDAREDKSIGWEQWSADLGRRKNIKLGRLGKPEEAARAIFFLATPLASFTTGSHVDISGGLARHV